MFGIIPTNLQIYGCGLPMKGILSRAISKTMLLDSGLLLSVKITVALKRSISLLTNFVKRSASNPVARRVKLADLEENMDLRRMKAVAQKDFERLAKYLTAWQYLKGL